jgi:plasmid stability protein
MAQLTVRLPEDLDAALRSAAARLQRKRGELVRMALRQLLMAPPSGKPAERARSLLGSLESGVPDLADDPRRYLLESLRREE